MAGRTKTLGLGAALLAAVALGGCDQDGGDGGDDGPASCEYEGETYSHGETFPAADGCNTCQCEDGQVLCTLMGCPVTCEYEGETWLEGQTFPAGDGCNTCECAGDGEVSCTDEVCDPGCEYAGQSWDVGDSFPAGDGCNTCECMADGTVACTELPCPVTCEYGGETYQAGDTFPAGDGCNTCECTPEGDVVCTELACPVTCEYAGETYQAGDSFPAGDGCNTCECTPEGDVVCTELDCPVTCEYGGETHQAGDTFPAEDGCNTCTCGEDGSVGCTKVACACDPEAEWWRDYVGQPVEECEVILFGCDEGLTAFENDCGCGCEQPVGCPQYLKCPEGESCDLEALAAECPLSESPAGGCTAELACSGQPFEQCWRPDEPLPCGMCRNPMPEEVCQEDAECPDGQICEGGTDVCTCSGEKLCILGCTSEADCGEGEVCSEGNRCLPAPCEAPEDCPADFSCEAGGCQRATCQDSHDCRGWCVGGFCYTDPGYCSAVPP